jgi:zinc protease
LIHELLTESIFPENEFTKTISDYKTRVESGRNEPQSIAFREISRKTELYPASHPFYTPSFDEQIAALNALTCHDVTDFYQNILGANKGLGTVVGDLDAAVVDKLVASAFGNWDAKTPYRKIQPQYFETKASEELINTPDKENAAVVGGVSFRMDRKNPDYPAMVIANEMLGQGGFMTARIPARLREKEGISYGTGSFQSIPYDNDVASWGVYAFFNPTVQSKVDAALKEEINKALTDGFTKEELETTLKGWFNDRAVGLGLDNVLVSLVNGTLYYGNSLDDYTDLETKVKALKVEDVNAVLAKCLKTSGLVLIYAGDFK